MTFSLTGWMLYSMLIVLGLMWLDFLFAFFRSLMSGSFNLLVVLNYLKDMVYYVFPLFLIVNLFPLDPIGWILKVIYFTASIGVILKYLLDIANKLK